MVKEHLLNPEEFWGEYLLPSISRDDPAYPEQYYWRGAIYAPMNYLVYEGLKRYGFDEVAADLVKKTYSLVKMNWDRTGGLYENYNSINGEGDPGGAQSTIHYSWSASLPLLAVMELIDVEAWGGLRFGSLGATSSADNVQIGSDYYSVHTGPETHLWRNQKQIFTADGAVVVRNFDWSARHLAFEVKTRQNTSKVTMKLASLEGPSTNATLTIDSKPSGKPALRAGEITLSVPGGEHAVELNW
jgi:hypothetical protein